MIRKLRKQLRKNRGFTLVELMIVVAIVGILAALAIYGVSKYMANAKTAEARNGVGQIGKDGITAYFKEGMNATFMKLGTERAGINKLCDGATVKPVPAEVAGIGRKKYQSAPLDWATWDCIHFSMNDPQYYRYDYKTNNTGDALADVDAEFTASAQGDLDGDKEYSYFKMYGRVQKDDKGSFTATLSPNIEETAPSE